MSKCRICGADVPTDGPQQDVTCKGGCNCVLGITEKDQDGNITDIKCKGDTCTIPGSIDAHGNINSCKIRDYFKGVGNGFCMFGHPLDNNGHCRQCAETEAFAQAVDDMRAGFCRKCGKELAHKFVAMEYDDDTIACANCAGLS